MAKRLCVFTDASDLHWGAVITQVPQDQLGNEFEKQEHQPLMFLSGTFSGAAKRWSVAEKEAFAIVETLRKADYLVMRSDGFLLFTDHRNLRYIFDPSSSETAMAKHTMGKLYRWALHLMNHRFEIHDISGDVNVWADLLSRWGSSFKTVCAIHTVPMVYAPQLEENFEWPTAIDILEAQNVASCSKNQTIYGGWTSKGFC